MIKPIPRSPIRIYLGKKYYRFKRYINWLTDDKRYAAQRDSTLLPHVISTHRTPLLRKLANVDMWLQHNKVINLRLAAKQLSGIFVEPLETFSYWRSIGNTTRKKGYVEGMVLSYGKVITGIGGGLCQLSNLIYWMTLHAPLTVKERYRHSYDVFPDSNRSQPFGSGATCFYNYLDLQILNETNSRYQLHVYVTDTHLVGEWRSEHPALYTYEVYEKKHWITQEFWGGYVRHNQLFRKVYAADGELINDEFITENHALMMYEPMLADKSSNPD
jgi:vancomycin resistance protein VanW